jgi:thymidylate synthase
MQNIQIYDRHIENAKILIERESVECHPEVWINPNKKDFFTIEPDDVKIIGYPTEEIKLKNPQLKFPLAI